MERGFIQGTFEGFGGLLFKQIYRSFLHLLLSGQKVGVARGPWCSVVVNQGQFVFSGVRIVTFFQGVP
jgi:hypothetical protein